MLFQELIKTLKTASAIEDITKFEVAQIMPKVQIMFDFDQQHRAHQYDLWEHSVRTVLNLSRNMDDDMLYLAALLHDIGKPDSQCRGKREDDPDMHYYGHGRRSMEIVHDDIIPCLISRGITLTDDECRRLLYYVDCHDETITLSDKVLKRHLKKSSLEEFKNLLYLQIADAEAHVMLPVIEEKIRICKSWIDSFDATDRRSEI